ncbi:hypothetical protein [Spirosoma radiotolerans]|uniref:Uncharacterized protein n=1 Tax=Spirosoma radiotolerans TaxID=1379870 RepID=A0A0E3V858_9BACT|nr:hypothetical protein [Spirosoma radiotolerans]AKD56001.1 hypothetical protein SD10_14900 [Spirosoma radiotolerans]
MKKTILGVALLATLTTLSFAGDIRKDKKVKKAASAACDKAKSADCEKGSGHACCMKKAQA